MLGWFRRLLYLYYASICRSAAKRYFNAAEKHSGQLAEISITLGICTKILAKYWERSGKGDHTIECKLYIQYISYLVKSLNVLLNMEIKQIYQGGKESASIRTPFLINILNIQFFF